MASENGFEDIARAVRRRFGSGASVENVVVPTLGGSNRTVVFDVVERFGRRRMVSRQETYKASNSPFLSTADQFRAMQVAYDHDIPVPEPLFEFDKTDGLGAGFVTDFVDGETMPKVIQSAATFADVRPRLVGELGEILARLHAIPIEPLAFLAASPDSGDPLRAQRDRYDSYAQPRPAIELGLRWLERHRPPPARRVAVHGDFRLGNFMVSDSGVVALLDWECAHLGDPIEDLGWLCTRSWRFAHPEFAAAGLGTRDALFAGYGGPVDLDAERYWEVFGLVRWAILNMMQGDGHVRGTRPGLVYAACGRNTALVEYELLMTLVGHYD